MPAILKLFLAGALLVGTASAQLLTSPSRRACSSTVTTNCGVTAGPTGAVAIGTSVPVILKDGSVSVGPALINGKTGAYRTNLPVSIASSGLVTSGLLAVYLFDEGTGATILDYSGNGFHGRVVGGGTWTATGLSMKTTSQYVAIPDGAWLTAKTVQWVATGIPTASAYGIIGGPTGSRGIMLNNNFITSYATGPVLKAQESSVHLWGTQLNTVVWDSTQDHVYRNGTESAYQTQTGTGVGSQSSGGKIGQVAGAWELGGGTISFVALYSTELTQLQAAQNAAAVRKIVANRGKPMPLLVFGGDSLTAGVGASTGNSYPSQLSKLLGGRYAVFNSGIGGATTTSMVSTDKGVANADGQFSIFNPQQIAIILGGTNDVTTQATSVSNLSQWCTDRKAAGFDYCLIGTLTARANSDTTNWNISRSSFNTAILGITSADAFINYGADPNFNPASASTNTLVYQSDQLHMTDYGYGVMAELARNMLLANNIFGDPQSSSLVSLVGQTASVATTNLLCGGAICGAGVYRASVYLVTTAGGASATVLGTMGWNDGTAARTAVTSTLDASTTNYLQQEFVVRLDGANSLTYATTLANAATYSIYIALERML